MRLNKSFQHDDHYDEGIDKDTHKLNQVTEKSETMTFFIKRQSAFMK